MPVLNESCKAALGLVGCFGNCDMQPEVTIIQPGQCGSSRKMNTADLPSEEEFFAAISDGRNVVLQAKGGQISVYSGALQQCSQAFMLKFSAFLQGNTDPVLYSQAGKAVLDLDCSLDTAEAVAAFVSSKGRQALKETLSPATLRELAAVSHEWGITGLLLQIDELLAQHVRRDMRAWSTTDAKSWQYSCSHIRQRCVQTFVLASEVGLTQTQMLAEIFLAANWSFLSGDERLAKNMHAEACERIKNLAHAMQRKMMHQLPVSGRAYSGHRGKSHIAQKHLKTKQSRAKHIAASQAH